MFLAPLPLKIEGRKITIVAVVPRLVWRPPIHCWAGYEAPGGGLVGCRTLPTHCWVHDSQIERFIEILGLILRLKLSFIYLG